MQFNLKQNNEENDVEWVSWSKDLKKVGDTFQIEATSMTFKEEGNPTFFIINENEKVGTSVFCTNHPDSKYPNSTPHGVRLANAIGRASELTGSVDADSLIQSLTFPVQVKVEKTEKGVLWSVSSE